MSSARNLTAEEWRYRFRIQQPANQDAFMLVCTRWRQVDDGDMQQQYLSTEGWTPYQGYDILQDIPIMDGRDVANEERTLRKVRELIEGIVTKTRG